MENLVQDPNQLTLGLEKGVPTKEIQDRIDRFFNEQIQRLHNSEMQNRREVQVLTEAGFVEGRDFDNTFEVVDVVEERDFSRSWYRSEEEPCMVQVAYKVPKGGVNLKTSKYEVVDGKIEISERNLWFSMTSDNKIECSTLVGTYRAVKPETLLRKLGEFAQAELYRAQRQVEAFNQNQDLIAKLTKEYPQASVEKKKISRTEGRFDLVDRVVVSFEDGSYLAYAVNYKGEGTLDRVFDSVEAQKTLEEKAAIVASRNA